jgi:hypothetical protein
LVALIYVTFCFWKGEISPEVKVEPKRRIAKKEPRSQVVINSKEYHADKEAIENEYKNTVSEQIVISQLSA